jgi:hypothetical protein
MTATIERTPLVTDGTDGVGKAVACRHEATKRGVG